MGGLLLLRYSKPATFSIKAASNGSNTNTVRHVVSFFRSVTIIMYSSVGVVWSLAWFGGIKFLPVFPKAYHRVKGYLSWASVYGA